MIKLVTKHPALIITILISIVLRVMLLGEVPKGITHDELGYVYNAYSLAKTGKNVFGETLPFLTWLNPNGNPFMPAPLYLGAPFFWFLPPNTFTGRLPSALLGVLDVVLVYLLVVRLFRHKSLALLSSLFVAISPWHLHFSRSAYDPNHAVFFYLLGIVLFLWEADRKKLPFFSIVSLLLAVFSYRGMNALFPALVVILLVWGWKELSLSRRFLATFGLGVGLICILILTTITIVGNRYIAEGLVDQHKMQEEIDLFIREAKGPLFVRRLFLNKPMYYIARWREQYLKVYSPEFLFLYTDSNQIYSIWSRGRIYAADLVFIIVGWIYLFRLKRKAAFFILGLFIAGGLPGMIAGHPYSARTLFLSTIIPIVTSGGVLFVINKFSQHHIKAVAVFLILCIYGHQLGSYLFDYYGRYADSRAESWAYSLRQISELIEARKNQFEKLVVSKTTIGDAMQYAWYAGIPPERLQETIATNKEKGFYFDNVQFVIECPKQQNPNSLYIDRSCFTEATPSAIIADYAGNTVWKVYEQKEI